MNTNLPLISVITTFFNAEKFIINALGSVDIQKFTKFNIEYIIVDDKSEDKSREMVDVYVNKVSKNKNIRYKVIEPDKNLGCGGARKFGIEHAKGNYFMFLDADDYYINSDFIQRAYDDITSKKADIVEYGVVYNQTDGNKTPSCSSNEITITDPTTAELYLFRDNLIKFNVWSKIYTKDIVNSYEYSDVRTFEDVRTIPIWVSKAKKIVIMPSCEINYRAVDGSIIRGNHIDTRLGTISAISSLFENFKDNKSILKAMYGRAMVDLDIVLHNHSSENYGFNEMSGYNTKMLSYIYPETYKELTYSIEEENKIENK